MAYKNNCKGVSYSSNRNGWLCPYCGKDIDDFGAKIANN